MSGMISTIYNLLLLKEKQEGGAGLTMDDVIDLERYESDLQGEEYGRQYKRLDLRISALVRHPGHDSVVQILDFSPGGMRVTGCPALPPGTLVEMHLRESEDRSFRFPSQIMWIGTQDEKIIAGIRFVGRPIQINHGPPSDGPENIVDRIQVA